MYQISKNATKQTLAQLHRESSSEFLQIMKGFSKSIFRKMEPLDMKKAYLAISESQGKYIFDLLVRNKSKHIVEFGTSFGISTIYLAAAAEETNGKVITTEILPNKCKVAAENFEASGLSPYIDLREGDALETLSTNVDDGIDFLLLDGWNELYLPLLKMLEPKFKKGTLIYTDNASFASAQPFIQYLRNNPDKYKTQRLQDEKGGSELSEYLG